MKRFAAAIIISAAAVTGVFAFSGAAQASVGGNCPASLDKKVLTAQPDQYRVEIKCSSLNANSKARGDLVRPNNNDLDTAWFTQLNTTYYGDWGSSVGGTPTAKSEITSV